MNTDMVIGIVVFKKFIFNFNQSTKIEMDTGTV